MPGSCFQGIAQLTSLIALELGWRWRNVDEPLQQLLSQSLPLQRLCLKLATPVLDMSALASLTELIVDDWWDLQTRSKLPAQLQHFSILNSLGTSPLLGLQQLQRVSFCVVFDDPEQLRRLAQLPALRHVSLKYCDAVLAAPTAPAWQHLPQLSELDFEYNDTPSRQEMAAILAGVAAATSLTKLSLEACALVADQDEAGNNEATRVAACASLAGLSRLRGLTISGSRLVPGDALALTALTTLTRLDVTCTGSAADDVAASALACSLTELRSLDLGGCAVGLACLAPIAHLIQLTELLLGGVDGMTGRGVMLLTKLTQLQRLTVQHNDEVTQEWMDQEFWAALRRR
jgi:hypothetical protein